MIAYRNRAYARQNQLIAELGPLDGGPAGEGAGTGDGGQR
jgi:hypothetical protein